MTENGNRRARPHTAAFVGGILIAAAVWSAYRGNDTTAALLSCTGILLVLMNFVRPDWALRFHSGWMRVAGVLGRVNTRLLLGLLYYSAITPAGFLMRRFGRDELRLRQPGGGSFWIPRASTRPSRQDFEHLF